MADQGTLRAGARLALDEDIATRLAIDEDIRAESFNIDGSIFDAHVAFRLLLRVGVLIAGVPEHVQGG